MAGTNIANSGQLEYIYFNMFIHQENLSQQVIIH